MTDWTGHIDVIGFGAFVLMGAGWMLRYLIKSNERMATRYEELVENHLQHNTAALIELKNVLQEVKDALRR